MGNPFAVFTKDPKNMPGQSLAAADQFDPVAQKQQYADMMKMYQSGLNTSLSSEQQFGPRFANARLNTLDTTLTGTSDTPGVSKMYLDALRQSDPESARLMDMRTQSAISDLGLDNKLDTNQRSSIEQYVRGGQAARGLGYGNSDVFMEMLMKLGYGDQLRTQRRAFAGDVGRFRIGLAQRPADMAIQTSMNQDPSVTGGPRGMWEALLATYNQGQENNRQQARLETGIGQQQAEIWNDWAKTGVGMGGGGGGGGMMG